MAKVHTAHDFEATLKTSIPHLPECLRKPIAESLAVVPLQCMAAAAHLSAKLISATCVQASPRSDLGASGRVSSLVAERLVLMVRGCNSLTCSGSAA